MSDWFGDFFGPDTTFSMDAGQFGTGMGSGGGGSIVPDMSYSMDYGQFGTGNGPYVPNTSYSTPSMNYALNPNAPTPSQTPQGGGGSSWWGDILGGLGKGAQAIVPALGLATSGMGLYAGIKGMQQAGEDRRQMQRANAQQEQVGKTSMEAANTALGSGSQLVNAGTQAMMGGPLPAGLEAQARQYEDSLRAQVQNYLAKSGLGQSSSAQQWNSYIKQQAATYRQQLAAGLMQPGSTNLGIATGALGNASASAARGIGQFQASQNGLGMALDSANRALNTISAAAPRQKKPGE